MGGVGSGGRRPGVGRKPLTEAERAARGSKKRGAARVLTHPSSPAGPPAAPPLPTLDETDAPNDLQTDERLVWLKLAPHAMANGTLTPATELAFAMLCRNIVLLKAMYEAPLARGTADHRGLIQRVDAELLRFNLSPCGKPMADAAGAGEQKPVSPLDRFLKKSRGA